MNRFCFAVAAFCASPAVVAGNAYYVDAGALVWSSYELAAPELNPTHPVTTERSSSTRVRGWSLAVGRMLGSGWYAELGGTNRTTSSSSYAHHTEYTASTGTSYNTKAFTDYEDTQGHIFLGKRFEIVSFVDVFAEAGAVYHGRTESTEHIASTKEVDLSTFEPVSSTLDTQTESTSDNGTSYIAGLGIALGDEGGGSKIRARYSGLTEEASLSIGLSVRF